MTGEEGPRSVEGSALPTQDRGDVRGVVVLTADAQRLERMLAALGPARSLRTAADLKQLTDALLWDDSETVVLDVEHPAVDPLEAVRLVKGTRWDVRLVCIGTGEGAARAARAGVDVLAPAAWDDLSAVLD